MKQELATMKQHMAETEQVRNTVQKMFDEGVLKQDDDGSFVAVTDKEESEHIRSTIA